MYIDVRQTLSPFNFTNVHVYKQFVFRAVMTFLYSYIGRF